MADATLPRGDDARIPAMLPEGWIGKKQDETAKVYFYNSVTGDVQWDRPEELADPRAQALLMLRQAAAAAADFVRCPESVGSAAGYEFSDGASGSGYYRRPDAPPPDDTEFSAVMLQVVRTQHHRAECGLLV